MGKLLTLVLLAFGTLFYSPLKAQEKKTVELEHIWRQYQFYPGGVDGFTGMADGSSYAAFEGRGQDKKIIRFDFATATRQEVLFSLADHEILKSVDNFSFSPDEEGILLTTKTRSIYRHSSRAMNYIYHRPDGSLHLLYEKPVRNATFSPTEDKVAFSFENNLYIKDLPSDQIVHVTKDGAWNNIINGTPDWVYEEEFSYDRAFEWSPDGRYLAYVRFDELAVPEFSMDVYGKALYPNQEVFKYPKAGEVNSKVSLFIHTLGDYSREVKLEVEFEYLPRIYWTPEGDLVAMVLNRLQNEMKLIKIDAQSLEQEVIYTDSDEAYLELPDVLEFPSKDQLLISSDRDGFNRIYLCKNNNCVGLTEEEKDVTDFYGYDEKRKVFYYQSPPKGKPHQREVYRANLKGKREELSTEEGWNSLKFNPQMSWYIVTHESASTPPVYTLYEAKKDKKRMLLQDNDVLKKRISEYEISWPEFFMAPAGDHELSAWMIKPSDFDPKKKYPVLCFVYGGPGSQTVTDEYDGFNTMWYQVLADQGYIIASADNRGTGARGRDFRKCTYRELGKLETEDQISFGKYLSSLPYVDGDRIGIWGWSYGGYMSSLCLSKGADVFKAAIAVAPVTNWRFYDNIYTERYMGLPKDNGSGYDDNSPINHVDKIKGKYMLIHGSADDNVHVQNSMRMVESLVQADVDFDLFIYPDKNHGIYGGNTRMHLYRKMTNFILENL